MSAEREDVIEGKRGRDGGFRSQPLALRLLLALSVAAIATGVVRCSFELTAPTGQAERIGVSVATGTAEPDSAVLAVAERFALELAALGHVEAEVTSGSEGAYDVLAALRIEEVGAEILVNAELTDAATRRFIGTAEASGPRASRNDVAALAARRAVEMLGLAASGPGEARE